MGDSRDNRGGLEHRPVVPGATGLAGAAGREGSVQGLLSRSYDAGFHAPQYDFDGEVYRGVKSPYADTFLDHTKGAKWGGRYNAPGLSLIYTSPSASEAAGEAGAYEGMGERSLMRSRYSASLDPTTGTGGVADLFRGMYAENLAESAVTVPKGKGQGPLSYRVLGEHPYSMSQQMGKGATDAGASAIQAPSATGGEQIDIIPRNTAPSQIQPIDRVPYDRAGAPQAVEPATTAKPMPPDLMAQKPGMLDMRAGSRDRASSLRYGALGGGVASLGSDLYEARSQRQERQRR